MRKMKVRDMRAVAIASSLCILLCLSSALVSAQLFPTPSPGIPKKLEISAPALQMGITDKNGPLPEIKNILGVEIPEAKIPRPVSIQKKRR